MKSFRLLAVASAIFCLALPSLYSQTSEGRILGTVFDQTGAVIAGAKVTVTNTATNVSRQLTTTSAGDYVAPNLGPGPLYGGGGGWRIQESGERPVCSRSVTGNPHGS